MSREVPSSLSKGKKVFFVTFDMDDKIERDLVKRIDEFTNDFSKLMKHLLFSFVYKDSFNFKKTLEETNDVKKSGIPFG